MVASVSTTSSYARRSLSFSDTIKRSPCYRQPNTPDIKIKYYYKSIINLWMGVVWCDDEETDVIELVGKASGV